MYFFHPFALLWWWSTCLKSPFGWSEVHNKLPCQLHLTCVCERQETGPFRRFSYSYTATLSFFLSFLRYTMHFVSLWEGHLIQQERADFSCRLSQEFRNPICRPRIPGERSVRLPHPLLRTVCFVCLSLGGNGDGGLGWLRQNLFYFPDLTSHRFLIL